MDLADKEWTKDGCWQNGQESRKPLVRSALPAAVNRRGIPTGCPSLFLHLDRKAGEASALVNLLSPPTVGNRPQAAHGGENYFGGILSLPTEKKANTGRTAPEKAGFSTSFQEEVSSGDGVVSFSTGLGRRGRGGSSVAGSAVLEM